MVDRHGFPRATTHTRREERNRAPVNEAGIPFNTKPPLLPLDVA
jgi:hypothetical protein